MKQAPTFSLRSATILRSRSLSFSLSLCACLLLSSCATMLTGTRQNVSISSVPAGAKVKVDGLDKGKTPLSVSLKKGHKGQTISLSADGYETNTFQPGTNFNGVTLINIIFPAFFGVDMVTGAMWKYHPKAYNIELERKAK